MSAGRPSSVQRKLVGMALISTMAAVLIAIAAMVVYDLRLYRTGWIADVTTQAELLGRTSGSALAFDDPRAARENLELLRYRSEVRAAAIYDAKGRLFASYAPAADTRFPSLAEGDGVRVEGDNLILFKRIVGESEILGTVYLRTSYALYDRLYGYLGIGVAAGLLSLLVAYALSRRLQRGVTGPLRAIGAVARKVSHERDYALRVQKLTPDEIGDPYNLGMTARVNGEEWSRGNSGSIYWRFEQMIEFLSRDDTVYPGDVLGSGTVATGCGLELDRWVKRGDVMELEIEKIGVLRNRVNYPV